MALEELEKAIEQLRARPLLLLCRTPTGREKVMTLEECCQSGGVYIRLVADDLDMLLTEALGGKE